jgi:hypothetical protein
MSHPVRHPRLAAVLGAALILAACGSSEPPDPPDISLGMSLVTVDRPLLLPGDTAQVTVQVRDAAGEREGVVILFLTLSLNGALWGAVIGVAIALGSLGHKKRITPES